MVICIAMNTRPLLTIAIPSFNRCRELSLLLGQIRNQFDEYRKELEVIVSDNCSSDETSVVVSSFIEDGLPIRYFRNEINVGSGANVVRCFELAVGRYVLIVGDDDLLLDGALSRIMSVLKEGDIGLLYLNAYPFLKDHRNERPASFRSYDLVRYQDPSEFLARVSINLSFLSSVIVNKSLVPMGFDCSRFSSSYLPQLNWIFYILFRWPSHAVLNQFVIAGRANNSGGYGVCQVFGANLRNIIDSFVQDGIPEEVFEPLHASMIRSFFPKHLLDLRTSRHNFADESFHRTLCPLYGDRLDYWIFLYPILRLPSGLAKIWFFGLRCVNGFNTVIRLIRDRFAGISRR